MQPFSELVAVALFNLNFAKYSDGGLGVSTLAEVQSALNTEIFSQSVTISDLITTQVEFTIFLFCFAGVYFVLCWKYTQCTLGKFLFRMRVLDSKSLGSLSMLQCILRYMGYLLFPINILSIMLTKKKIGLHDKIAKSVSVKM
jgi:uncharacterized RDD family membrane protein YckC